MVERWLILLVGFVLLAPGFAATPLTPPTPPRNAQAAQTAAGVQITWDPPLFDGGDPNLYYRVYRNGQLVADKLDTALYVDTSASSDKGVGNFSQYFVTAVNHVGESQPTAAMADPHYCVWWIGVNPDECIGQLFGAVWWVIDQITLPPHLPP